MDREVKVRIDLVLDNQASLLDSVKQINQQIDKYEEKLKRLKNLQATGNYNYLLEKEVDLLRKKNEYQRNLSVANQPFMEARRRLDVEDQIFKIQQQRSMLRVNRPHELSLMVNQERAAKEKADLARDAHYQARYGRLGGAMNIADRLSMSGFGYGAMSASMLGAVGAAGGATLNTFMGTLKRASGEIGLMFIPAILNISSHLHSFAGWVRGLNPTLKTTIGYLATYGLLFSAGAKVFSMVVSGFTTLKDVLTSISASRAIGAAGNSVAVGGTAKGVAAAVGIELAWEAIQKAWNESLNRGFRQSFNEMRNGNSSWRQTAANAILEQRRSGGLISWGDQARTPPPLSIPGFQSQQMGIFDLKDAIQRESLRDPNEQANFELSVREFRELIGQWTEWFANNPRGVGDMRIG